ncbi:MAG TPA: hypothetical protein VF595_06965 [Tepidisphaeraceae bacterium]
MGLEQSLANRPAVTNALTVGVIVVALAFIAFDLLRPRPAGGGTRLYFTTDDGQTTFPHEADRLPPFDVEGKPAVRAYVYACEGGKPFVAYLERYTSETLAKLTSEDARKHGLVDRDFILADGAQVKRPGESDWVKRGSEAGEAILDVKCPAGDNGVPMLVLPGD